MPVTVHHSAAGHPAKLFGRQRPLHAIFGGGYVADLIFWRNKYLSASILLGFSIIWILFEVVEYNFIPLLCHILILVMLILSGWTLGAGLVKGGPPKINHIKLSESTCNFFLRKINWFLFQLYEISCGKDFKALVLTIASLWLLSIIGSFFSFLNFTYIVIICLGTVPVLYEKYEGEVDDLAGKSNQEMKNLFKSLSTKVLDKIPREVKEKKSM